MLTKSLKGDVRTGDFCLLFRRVSAAILSWTKRICGVKLCYRSSLRPPLKLILRQQHRRPDEVSIRVTRMSHYQPRHAGRATAKASGTRLSQVLGMTADVYMLEHCTREGLSDCMITLCVFHLCFNTQYIASASAHRVVSAFPSCRSSISKAGPRSATNLRA